MKPVKKFGKDLQEYLNEEEPKPIEYSEFIALLKYTEDVELRSIRVGESMMYSSSRDNPEDYKVTLPKSHAVQRLTLHQCDINWCKINGPKLQLKYLLRNIPDDQTPIDNWFDLSSFEEFHEFHPTYRLRHYTELTKVKRITGRFDYIEKELWRSYAYFLTIRNAIE